MCTVSVIPSATESPEFSGGFRLVSNRDESRTRAASLAPAVHAPRAATGGIPGVWPVDPDGGGTWIGANAAGVVLTILNVYRPELVDQAGRAWVSRGLVIPALAGAPSAMDAAMGLSRFELPRFHPFRLVAVDRERLIECRWDGVELGIAEGPVVAACFSSHGWGDKHARHRLHLFRRWFGERAYTPGEQDAFHRHRWPSRPEVSVRMSRDESRTVSITSVTVGEGVEMVYEPLEAAAAASVVRLETMMDFAAGAPA
jgi:hypothetical protein